MYDVQGARSGVLPVSYLSNTDYPFSQCIGLFAYYNGGGSTPAVNETLTTLGYQVGPGGPGQEHDAAATLLVHAAVCMCTLPLVLAVPLWLTTCPA